MASRSRESPSSTLIQSESCCEITVLVDARVDQARAVDVFLLGKV